MERKGYTILLMAVAVLGGILYGYDLGIIGIAFLYLKDCVPMTEGEKGLLVAAVMLGAPVAGLLGGGFADLFGRKKAMIISALLFIASVVVIVASHSYVSLFCGRVLQGLSAGMIAIAIPIYMSENAPAKVRGLSATMFQLCICLGYAVSMGAGYWYQTEATEAMKAVAGTASVSARIVAIKDHAWRLMFQTSAYPAIVFLVVAFLVVESPRWLFRRGRRQQALATLLKSRDQAQAELELREMEELAASAAQRQASAGDSVFQMRYMLPVFLAVMLMGINQATGINSVLPFMALMLNETGFAEALAGKLAMILTVCLFVPTIFGVLLVDRLGRKKLLMIGTGLIVLALVVGAATYWRVEAKRMDVSAALREKIQDNGLTVPVKEIAPATAAVVQVSVQYAYGDNERTCLVRSDAQPDGQARLVLKPGEDDRAGAALTIRRAKFSEAPSPRTGYVIFGCILVYLVGFCFGPGVCLWLMSAELMPTRVRSLGMGIGVVANAGVSSLLTFLFLPIVGNFGYAAMWAVWAVCTLAYFLFAAFALPETRGKTLEEIEAHFTNKTKAEPR